MNQCLNLPTRMTIFCSCLIGLLWGSGFAPTATAADRPSKQRPNILFIMVDDLGKEWIHCYGAQNIKTPQIDALAAGGMQFENAWCMPQCTPTRMTLLTGQYPFRHGWTNHFDVPRWGSGAHFDATLYQTFAQVLRKTGYATAIAGKWQIDDFRVEPKALDEAGFDEWCVWTGYESGNPDSNSRYWDPYVFHGKESKLHQGKFGPDLYCDFLVDFIRRHKDKPMMLYYPMAITHGPLVHTPADPDVNASPLDKHKAMVRYTDHLVGRVVTVLDELKLREKTIIIFTTDNGSGSRMRGHRLGKVVRGAKAKMHEAGVAMPFVVNGPTQVPAGVTTDALTDFTDMLPTFAELAGAKLDDKYKVDGHSIAPLLLGQTDDSPRTWIYAQGGGRAAFRNNRVVPVQMYDDRVIRDKRWKLWVDTEGQAAKLFDMNNDPWETKNLIDSTNAEAKAAHKKLFNVIQTMPKKDAAPRYRLNPVQKWDQYKYRTPSP